MEKLPLASIASTSWEVIIFLSWHPSWKKMKIHGLLIDGGLMVW
jgi:hypothetical protein